jgi:aldehyde dehydrogenase (NAD+)
MNAILKNPNALYIDAEWVRVSEAEEVLNPATEEVIGLSPLGNKAAADAAIGAAYEAFHKGPWPRLGQAERKAKMQAFHDALMRRREEIISLIIAEAGAVRTIAEAYQFDTPMRHLQHFIDICERDVEVSLPVTVNPGPDGTKILAAGLTRREPVGVVSAITAYNFPFLINLGKIAPALLVGCTVVLKPSPYTPFQALILGEAAAEAGLPKGVLNIITGGIEVGTLMTSDPRVDLVTFTGSDAVGAAIQAQAAPTLKRLVQELGGKSALIVRPDADMDRAAAAALAGFTTHSGQGCNLMTRHLVPNSMRKAFVAKLKGMAEALRLGDPNDRATQMGPLINAIQRQKTEDYVAIALGEGAELVAGGKRPAAFPKGFYHEPTLFDGVHRHFRIAQEEVFGPIGVVIGYDTDEEAIAIANESEFGLNASIFTADVGRALEMARELRTGGVSINGGGGRMSSVAPFGGIKRSGYGREYGVEGLNEYTYLKAIQFRGG